MRWDHLVLPDRYGPGEMDGPESSMSNTWCAMSDDPGMREKLGDYVYKMCVLRTLRYLAQS